MKNCPQCQVPNLDANLHCFKCGQGFGGANVNVGYAAPQQNYAYPQTRQPLAPQFNCPFCRSNAGYYIVSKISTGGWVVFILLFLFLCWPLCWIGFLIKDEFRQCRACHMRLG